MEIQEGQPSASNRNLPLILLPLKEKVEESDKSLFQNNSVSSEQIEKCVESKPMQVGANSKLPEVDQIRKFLKRGDQINNSTFKRLKEDRQLNDLAKLERSSTSLYKSARHIDFPMNEDEKQAEIRRLYLSHKRQPSKVNFRTALYKFNKTSQQVQTEEQLIGGPLAADPPGEVATFSLHKPSYMTIDVVQEETSQNSKPFAQQPSIEPDEEENKLLPLRGKRGSLARAKALSTSTNQNNNNLNSYLKAMAKLDYSFHTTLNKFSQRYKEYGEQQTVFSKTIDVKPLKPLQDTLSNFGQGLSEFKSQPTTAIIQKNESRATHQLPTGLTVDQNTSKNRTISVEAKPESRVKNNIGQNVETAEPHIISTIKQATNEKDSSILPEYSRQAHSNSFSKEDGRKTSRIVSRMTPFLATAAAQHVHQKTESLQKGKAASPQKSELIQVPSVHELKVGQGEVSSSRIVHPIRQNFSNQSVDWIQSNYRPKSDIINNFLMATFQIKKYQNGVYFGDLSPQGKKHGKGVIFYFAGKIYQGNFSNDLKHGLGHEYFPDGSSYKGEFREGVRHGRGVFEWSNGQLYDGQWERGRKTGSGMWKSPEGESYIGQWKKDKVEGFGVFVMKNSSRYEGQFKNSLKHGTGTERFNNGETYVGSYERNRPNGEGEYYWANGDYYKGFFSNGLRHRQGYFRQCKTGIEYRGEYHNDKKCGFGEISYGKGLVYRGNFENNFRHGYGELIDNGNLKYRGYWINDHQIDDENHYPLPHDDKIHKQVQAKSEKVKREDTIPKVVTRGSVTAGRNPALVSRAPLKGKKLSKSPEPKSISPKGDDDGYMRACRCNRKH